MSRRWVLVAVAALVLVALFFTLRPQLASGPTVRTFEVSVRSGAMMPKELSVVEGDRVTLRITADQAVRLHIHGYDLKVDVQPGAPARLEFEAKLGGRFEIEDELTERDLGELVVEPRVGR